MSGPGINAPEPEGNGACDILFLIRSMGRGGAERQLSLLARRLHAAGYRVVVACFYADGALLSELTDAGVPVLDLRKRGRWSNAGVAKRLIVFVGRHRPRVVHAYMPVENIMAVALKPWIWWYGGAVVCGVRIARFDAASYGPAMWLVYTVQRLMFPFADRVISNSADGLRQFGGWIRAGRGAVVPNGVEPTRFAPTPEKRAIQRDAWGVAADDVLVGIVGRLDPQKNHGLAINALQSVQARYTNVRLVIVGEGLADYRRSLQDHAASLRVGDRVIWAGPADDMTRVYAAIDIACLPSVAEGFPNVLAEAMSAGLPCVATDVGDAASLVGDAGWIVPSDDATALASALSDAISRLSTWDPAGPRQRIAKNFSDLKLAERTLAALSPWLSAITQQVGSVAPDSAAIAPEPYARQARRKRAGR